MVGAALSCSINIVPDSMHKYLASHQALIIIATGVEADWYQMALCKNA